ncbi:MAG TPA: alpha/beta fold hydrolase [Gemmatimonadales bacterium]|nr:alpha/beta fold hydrolase [Gemmatimonadales bacterium]
MNHVNAPDGTPLVFDAYEPAQPALAVLFLHDWYPQRGGLAERFAELGAQLRDAGFAAYSLDQRGHGRSGGRRGHLSRFSQLLGDLQTLRRAVRRRHDVPQILLGHGFGGLIVLRYLETQPGEPPAAAVVASPWLASRARPAVWKRLAAKLADLWPTLPTGSGAGYMTAGARAELQWAQRAVVADCHRIERPLLLLLGETDADIDGGAVRGLAQELGSHATLLVYPGLGHDIFAAPQVRQELSSFIAEYRASDRDRRHA